MKVRLLATAFAMCSATTALANPNLILCEFDRWDGNKDDVVISWLGEKVAIDTSKKMIQIGVPKGWYKPMSYQQVFRNENFTAYVHVEKLDDDSGDNAKRRRSFRVYNDGKGEALMTTDGYAPISARGTCKP